MGFIVIQIKDFKKFGSETYVGKSTYSAKAKRFVTGRTDIIFTKEKKGVVFEFKYGKKSAEEGL